MGAANGSNEPNLPNPARRTYVRFGTFAPDLRSYWAPSTLKSLALYQCFEGRFGFVVIGTKA